MHFFLSKGTVIGNGEVTGSNRPPSYYRVELDETNDVIKVTAPMTFTRTGGTSLPAH